MHLAGCVADEGTNLVVAAELGQIGDTWVANASGKGVLAVVVTVEVHGQLVVLF